MTDPAHLDELERQGDSLLDEEQWRSDPERCSVCGQPDNCGDCDHTPLSLDEESFLLACRHLWQVEGMVGDRLQLGFPGVGAIRLAPDDARNFANAILSELEIAQREGDGEW